MEKSNLITHIQEAIYYLRIQNYLEGHRRFSQLLQEIQAAPDISARLSARQEDNENILRQVLNRMLQALEATDMVLLADLLEEAFLPLIKEMVFAEEPVICGQYSLEYTSSGYLTVRHLPTNLYLHGNCNPMEEARMLVEHCFDPKKEHYAVWGAGLGYHIARLYEAAKGAVSIAVFEEDEELFRLTEECGILNELPLEHITYVVDKTGEKFARYVSRQDAGILLHFPSIKKIQDKLLKDRMSSLFISWNSMMNLKNAMAINFRSNQKNCSHNVDELETVFKGKEVVLIAAGPSLDDNLEFVREVSGKKVIVAVARVWKKMLDQGILPDYVVSMDAHSVTMEQLEGVISKEIPLIVDSTAYWGMAAHYGGEKYIAYQRDYEASEKCAGQFGYRLYETGGSVLTLCLDIVLQLGAETVYFAGVDLAYPGGWSHTSGTMDIKKVDISVMEQVESVNGDIVYSDHALIGFRKWIEKKITEYPQVKFYNLSTCGAKIAGAYPPKDPENRIASS